MLMRTEHRETTSKNQGSRITARHALWALIAISTILRLAWAASVGAAFDEPYYIQYIQHPAWSYFDHPPMVALLGALGLAITGDAFSVFGLRLGFILLFAGSTWLMARLTTRFFGAKAGLLAALALSASGYFGMAVATIAQPDGPLLFFWLLTLDRLAVALDDPDRVGPWLGVGAAWGGAMLSKYHAVLLPVGALLHIICWPQARRCSPKTGALHRLGDRIDPLHARDRVERHARLGLVLVPGWACGGRASTTARSTWSDLGRRGAVPVPLALDRHARVTRQAHLAWAAFLDKGESFLISQALPALVLFHAIASQRWIMPYWPLFGFIALMPLLGRAWEKRSEDSPSQSSQADRSRHAIPGLAGVSPLCPG